MTAPQERRASARPAAATVLALQATIANRAVGAALQRTRKKRKREADPTGLESDVDPQSLVPHEPPAEDGFFYGPDNELRYQMGAKAYLLSPLALDTLEEPPAEEVAEEQEPPPKRARGRPKKAKETSEQKERREAESKKRHAKRALPDDDYCAVWQLIDAPPTRTGVQIVGQYARKPDRGFLTELRKPPAGRGNVVGSLLSEQATHAWRGSKQTAQLLHLPEGSELPDRTPPEGFRKVFDEPINGDRFELWIDATASPVTAFDEELAQLKERGDKALKGPAQDQAKKQKGTRTPNQKARGRAATPPSERGSQRSEMRGAAKDVVMAAVSDRTVRLNREGMEFHWCHLVGHGEGGSTSSDKLMAGTKQANGEQLAIEMAYRWARSEYGPKYIKMKISGYPVSAKHPHVAKAIRYRLVGPDNKAIIDHWIDGLREHFDISQWRALKAFVVDRIKLAMVDYKIPGRTPATAPTATSTTTTTTTTTGTAGATAAPHDSDVGEQPE